MRNTEQLKAALAAMYAVSALIVERPASSVEHVAHKSPDPKRSSRKTQNTKRSTSSNATP
jgi:hypothetical protein